MAKFNTNTMLENTADGYICEIGDVQGLEEEVHNAIRSSTCIVHDALTNVNGYSLSGSYSATATTISANNTTYNVIIIKTNGGSKLTKTQAETYMKRQTGSYFLPVYTQNNPSFAYLIFGDGKIYKAQWDDTNGLVLWYCNQLNLGSNSGGLHLHRMKFSSANYDVTPRYTYEIMFLSTQAEKYNRITLGNYIKEYGSLNTSISLPGAGGNPIVLKGLMQKISYIYNSAKQYPSTSDLENPNRYCFCIGNYSAASTVFFRDYSINWELRFYNESYNVNGIQEPTQMDPVPGHETSYETSYSMYLLEYDVF